MDALRDCPGNHQLDSWIRGLLIEEQSAAIEEHLRACEACQRQTRELHHSDTLADAIRQQAAQPEDQSVHPELGKVMQRLREQSLIGTQSIDVAGTQIIPSGSGTKSSNDRTEFLSGLRPAEAPDELARLDGFRLLKLLGHGGMGAVFLAEDIRLKRRVAVKLLRPEFADRQAATERFLREAQAVAAVRHENVVAIYQVGQDQGVPFLAQELLEGETLDNRLKREGALPITDAIAIGQQIAQGLAAAHARGLIHRDIKPANVWLEGLHRDSYESSQGSIQTIYEGSDVLPGAAHSGSAEDIRVKLLDFGLARALNDTEVLTQPGVLLGTPAYMAPEQARGEVVDQRADLFSLGGVLYECVTGRRPFNGSTPMSILHALAVDTPASVESLRSDVPGELSYLIEQLLVKDRNARLASAQDVARKLAAIGRSVAESSTSAAIAPPRLNVFRSVSILAAVLILLGVIIINLKDKDGRETKLTLTVPDETKEVSVELKSDPRRGEPPSTSAKELQPDNDDSKPAVSEQSSDPDRKIANTLLKLGAVLQVKPRANKDVVVWVDASGKRGVKDLPALPFVVHGVSFVSEHPFNEDTLKLLKELRSLSDIEFWGVAITDSGMRHLADLTSLKLVALSDTPVTNDGLGFISNLSNLRQVYVRGHNGTTGTGMSHLANLRNLEVLDWYTTATDEDLKHLRNLTQITHLRLDGSPVNGSGFKHLSQLSKLSSFGLGGTLVEDANAQHWPEWPALRELHLHYTQSGDAVAKRIKSMMTLTTLNLEGSRVTNAGIADLTELPALSQLGFSQTAATEAVFPQLVRMKSLVELDLRDIQISEAGARNLAMIPSLQRVRVRPKQLSDATKSILSADLPKCRIDEF